MYADDTTITTDHQTASELERITNSKVETAADWFKANKLTLNAKKTRTMTISPQKSALNITIKLDDQIIKEISQKSDEKYFKFLGFRMDNRLTWTHHSKHVINKLTTANYLLATVKNYFPKHIKRLIYMALGQSHLEYGLPIWINKHAKTIEKLQKKCVRNICNVKYNAHTDKLFGDLKILKVKELHKIAAIRTIKKSHLKKTPETISNIFSKTEQTM